MRLLRFLGVIAGELATLAILVLIVLAALFSAVWVIGFVALALGFPEMAIDDPTVDPHPRFRAGMQIAIVVGALGMFIVYPVAGVSRYLWRTWQNTKGQS